MTQLVRGNSVTNGVVEPDMTTAELGEPGETAALYPGKGEHDMVIVVWLEACCARRLLCLFLEGAKLASA